MCEQYIINTVEYTVKQRFSIRGATRDFLGCQLLCQTVAKFIFLYKFVQYIKWCKGCKNDFSFLTGCGLQKELRTAAVKDTIASRD